MDNVEQPHSLVPDSLLPNEAFRQAFKAIRKFSMHFNDYGRALDVIRLAIAMTASIDGLRNAAHYVTEKDWNGNEEPFHSKKYLGG